MIICYKDTGSLDCGSYKPRSRDPDGQGRAYMGAKRRPEVPTAGHRQVPHEFSSVYLRFRV